MRVQALNWRVLRRTRKSICEISVRKVSFNFMLQYLQCSQTCYTARVRCGYLKSSKFKQGWWLMMAPRGTEISYILFVVLFVVDFFFQQTIIWNGKFVIFLYKTYKLINFRKTIIKNSLRHALSPRNFTSHIQSMCKKKASILAGIEPAINCKLGALSTASIHRHSFYDDATVST